MRRLQASVLIACAVGAEACTRAREVRQDNSSQLRPEGDPDRAVQAELDEARRKRTIEAYDLFIARQRQHPLARVARRERAALAARREK